MLTFKIEGKVRSKRSGIGKESKKPYHMVAIAYMGGEFAFMCDDEVEMAEWPPEGSKVVVTGEGYTDGGGRLRCDDYDIETAPAVAGRTRAAS